MHNRRLLLRPLLLHNELMCFSRWNLDAAKLSQKETRVWMELTFPLNWPQGRCYPDIN